jgi:hypothetical protein
MNFLCMIHHKWEDIPKPYPKLRVFAIRGCTRCGHIEYLNDNGYWFEFAEGWTISKWIAHMVKYYAPELPEYYFKASVANEKKEIKVTWEFLIEKLRLFLKYGLGNESHLLH